VDQKAPTALRAAAQGLITFITYGIGMFLGAYLSGWVVDLYANTSAGGTLAHNWRSIWMVPAIGSAIVLFIFLIGFRDEERAPT
jgi:MFS family permease